MLGIVVEHGSEPSQRGEANNTPVLVRGQLHSHPAVITCRESRQEVRQEAACGLLPFIGVTHRSPALSES